MTAYKVADLIGAHLDAAVAKAMGMAFYLVDGLPHRRPDLVVAEKTPNAHIDGFPVWAPSTRWEDGGPIIRREQIGFAPGNGDGASNLAGPDAPRDGWCAAVRLQAYGARDESGGFFSGEPCGVGLHAGPTPLIAAMRAFVASKFGETLELP